MPQVSGTMEAASQTDDDGARADGAVRVASPEPGFYRPMLELLWRCFGEARRLPQPLQCRLHGRQPAQHGLCPQDRLVYGSNWPVCDHARYPPTEPYANIEPERVYAEQFRIVDEWITGKGEEARSKFFSGNAKAAYKWVDRGS